MRTIVVTVQPDAVEIASDRLWAAGAAAVEERPRPGGRVELRTSLASDDAVSIERLGVLPKDWAVSFEDVDHVAADTWRQFARPIEIRPGLMVSPAWVEVETTPDVSVVSIEPGGSFGLGDHPTTRLTAAAAAELVGPGARVLDVGCGSGILSIVAVKCGAAQVVSIDIAEAAREATIDNAVRNDVEDRIEVSTAPIGAIRGVFDVVLANILAPALSNMAPDLRDRTAPQGSLIVSGVLSGRYAHLLEALRPMCVIDERHLDGWSAVTFRHQQC